VYGDIHGRADLLNQILARVDRDLAVYPECKRAIEVFLGDYIDRGPDSHAVIDRLVERAKVRNTVFLKGNHESCMLAFLRTPEMLSEWRYLGGLETMISYGLKPSVSDNQAEQKRLSQALNAALPKRHREFLQSLALSFTCGDFFFVHAGVRPGTPLSSQKEDDLIWIREEFLLFEETHGKMIVHGHTPVLAPEIKKNRINIDTGAYATGNLTCLILEGAGYFVL
jgi:serine/threonine protein phosphatase 1